MTIPAGQTTVSFPIFNNPDGIYEGDENYLVSIVSTTGGEYNELLIADDTVTTTINDAEAKPSLIINDQVINEQEGTMTFTVTLSGPTERDVTFDYTSANTTATAGADYTAVSGTKTIPAGSTSITITVPIHDDYLADNGETFKIILSNPSESAVIGDGVGVGTILDDTISDPYNNPGTTESDTPDTITIKLFALDGNGNRVAANEVAEGSNPSYIAVAFDKNNGELNISGTVQVAFTDNSATGSGTDYVSTTKTVTLGTAFTTTTTDDYLSDNNENFTVSLIDRTFSNAATYESIDIDTTAVTTTIKDNTDTLVPGGEIGGFGPEDTVYVQLITNDTVSEGGTLQHTVKLVDSHGTAITVAAGETISVNITYVNGAGLNSGEYTASSPITILGGTSFTTFDNLTNSDLLIELTESYTATISTVTQAHGTYEKVAPYMTSNGADGDAISVTGTIIDGVDAVGDAATVVEGSNTINHTIFGNLLDNDERGVAGTITVFTYKDETGTTQTGAIGTEVNTQYGKLTLNADGTWTYVSDPTESHGTIIDTIRYTLTDGSHSSQADFVITVTDTTPTAVADTNTISEEAVSVSGNVFGTLGATSGDNVDTIGADLTTTPVSGVRMAGSDVTTAVIGGFGSPITGTYGSVNIASDGTYTYTLDNTNLNVQHLTTNETLTDTFVYTITDADGDTSTTTLTITVRGTDDTPSITVNDMNAGANGDATVYESALAAGSNPSATTEAVNGTFVLSAKDGLDSIVVGGTSISQAALLNSGSTNITISTGEGTLVIKGFVPSDTSHQDGSGSVSYTYTLNAAQTHPTVNGNNEITDAIALSVIDRDLDEAIGTLNVTIIDDIPSAVPNTNSVTEDIAVNGSGNLVASGTVVGNDTIGADTTSAPVTGVRIAGSDTTTAAVGDVASPVPGTYGSVNIAADGAYTYTVSNTDVRIQHLKVGETLTDTFVYTITDSDGDSSTTTLAITINGTNDLPTIIPVDGNSGDPHTAGQATVYEAGLTAGSNPTASSETTTGTISVSAKDGLTSVSIGGRVITEAELLLSGSSTITINTGEGSLVIDGFTPSDATHQDGSGTIHYTYTLIATQAHATGAGNNEVTDAIALIVTSRNTATATGTLNVTIVDDVPTAVVETAASLAEGGGSTNTVTSTGADAAHYNLLTNDTLGADGARVTSITYRNEANTLDVSVAVPTGTTGVTVDTINGSLTVKADGSWSFTSDASVINTLDADATDTFTYVITDGDGDTASATKTFNISDGTNPTIAPVSLTVSETTLGTGAALAPFTVTGTALNVVQGSDSIANTKFTDATITDLGAMGIKSGGADLFYTLSADKHTITATKTNGSGAEVFVVTITNPASANAKYDFKLTLPLDHTKNADPLLDHDTSWILPFNVYTVDTDDNGTVDNNDDASGSFTVTVQDSTPTNVNQNVSLVEDIVGGKIIRLSQDAFNGNITLNNGHDGDQSVATNGSINIYDGASVIGTLTNMGDGTVKFVPLGNYSNYNLLSSSFTYTLTDNDGDSATAMITLSVTPVTDTPIWDNNSSGTQTTADNISVTTNEDTIVSLGLFMPTIKDATDNSIGTGDHAERLGYITLTSVDTGAKIYQGDGTTLLFTGNNDTMTIVIVTSPGVIDTTVHHTDLALGTAIQLTAAEFAALKILPPLNVHNDIDMTLSVTSFEVDDLGNKLTAYTGATSTALAVHVEVLAITDPIALSFDNTMSLGNITATDRSDDTFAYTATANEGLAAIDLKALLTNTSGTSTPLGDLDGSEQRSYTVSGIPEGTIINLGGTTATANASGIATVNFSNASELLSDPTFTITLPTQYSGTVNATIILSVYDQDADSTSINAGLLASPLTQTVYFNIVVAPVADITTLAVTQAQGDEDTPIALAIRPTSVDSSETFTITIADIPSGSEMIYNGTSIYTTSETSGSVTIAAFDSTKTLTIKPPFNSNGDFNLHVTAHSVDAGQTGASSSTLALSVDVVGVADSATISTSAAGTTEAIADNAGHKVALTTALVSAGLTDTDGSETLSVILTNLSSEFSIEGAAFMGGSGTDRKWVFPSGDLTSVFITTPANYSGTIGLQAYAVTTEDDGNSLKGSAIDLSIPVTPSTEATVNLSTTADEDALINVSFAIAHQNGDTDETLDAVWISEADVTGKEFTLYYGNNNTTPLANGQAGVLLEGGYYKLTGAAISNIYVQNSADKNGSYTFNIKTIISDVSSDHTTGTITTTSADTTYTLTVAAVTDPITIAAAVTDTADIDIAGNVVTLLGTRTTIDVPLTISQVNNSAENGGVANGVDIDGSETLLRLIVDGVPDGVSVVGGTYIGDTSTNSNTGRWLVEVNQDFTTTLLTPTLHLVVDGSAAQLNAITNKTITITAYSQDDGAGVLSATTTVILDAGSATFDDTSYTAGTPVDVSTPTAFVGLTPTMTEDTQSTLGSFISTDVMTAGTFSITLSDVPAGTVITGMTSTTVGAETFYYATGTSLSSLLSTITVQAPSNSNDNVTTHLNFKATVTSIASGGVESVHTLNISAPVTPVSDATTISITAGGVSEDNEQAIVITMSNPADTSRTTIIDGKLYLSVDDGAMIDGVLKQGATILSAESVTGVTGVPSGTYYVISGVNYNSTLNLTYTPASNASGSVALHAYLNSQETNAGNIITSDTAKTFAVAPVTDGINPTISISASGNEDEKIALVLSGTLLGDTDGSEKLYSATLSNVPNGYLVYIGGTTLAINAGSDGLGNNTWSIPLSSGALPAISILPPPNVSGTITGITLSVYSGESTSLMIETSKIFDLVIAPVSDSVTIYPTQTFGTQYTTGVALNLNASARDLDGSETATIILVAALGSSALSADAWFMNGASAVTADYVAGTWTLHNVATADLGNIMIYHPAYTGTVDVSVQMQDGSATASTAAAGNYIMTISSSTTIDTTALGIHDDKIIGTSGVDTISTGAGNDTINGGLGNDVINGGDGDDQITLNIGDTVNGGTGIDTLIFTDTNINFSGITNITNIEKIDLSGTQSISNLSLTQVFNMTDSNHILAIDGVVGGSESVATVSKTGWTVASGNGTVSGGYTEYHYTRTSDSATVTLKIDTDIQNTTNFA
ncbi:MAG: VCBS domain-containing protein [Sulfuricurvum sp.]|nr:VCBS domain-containing protein [Sulfuricurvum sp.]